MADPLTADRLAELHLAHDLCLPDDGPRCEASELLAEVDRLTADTQRLRDQNKASSDAWTRRVADMQSRLAEHGRRLAYARRQHPRIDWMSAVDRAWVLDILADRDRYTAVIDQVRALHRQAQPDKGFCEYCDETWPCPTAALLPPATQPADGTGHVHGWEIICVDGVPTHGQCRGCPATQNLETGEIQEGAPA